MTMPMGNTRDRLGYIDEMQQRSFDALTQLHRGVDALVFTDFPDHENIGDSAIALGQAEFWRRAGIRIEATYSWRTIDERLYETTTPVAIHGGGNFGGLYPRHSEHRYTLTDRLRRDTLLIQEPQSVHFTSDADRAEFVTRMASRPGIRLAVRDRDSLAAVSDVVPDTVLAPDSVHMLGRIDAPAPDREVVVLLRRDRESTLSGTSARPTIDWPAMTFADRVRQRLRRTLLEGAVTRTSNRSTARWLADATARVATGVALLAPGETVVTDRLHAMLIALQLGRRVIAMDNATGKLTSYARAWLQDLNAPLEFADDLPSALARV
ncbi:polysaccharide pyruvyl transferase family protein [Microbacterium sp.]|uniref:polysaccharide pyruvyl transferase family protein n=1 Tax=Microbacterium sp. TaxID=51671 RepID=UPI003C797059